MLKKTESTTDQATPSQLDVGVDVSCDTETQPTDTSEPGPIASVVLAAAPETPAEPAEPPMPVEPTSMKPKRATVTYLPFVTLNPDDGKPTPPDGDSGEGGAAPTGPKQATGSVVLNCDALRMLRHRKLLSQQDLADKLYASHFQISIATIKRAECGHPVRYRILRELAEFFGVDPADLLKSENDDDPVE